LPLVVREHSLAPILWIPRDRGHQPSQSLATSHPRVDFLKKWEKAGRSYLTQRNKPRCCNFDILTSPAKEIMSTFGYYPGPIDYWMLVTDWRNGSIAIMLVIGAFVVGYKFRTRTARCSTTANSVLPTHASPAIAEGEVDEGDAGRTPRAPAVQKMGPPERT
jgi:hypothetical protein